MHVLPILMLILGCGGGEPQPQPVPPAPKAAEKPAQDGFTSKMKLHYELATQARTAVIRGDLDAVHAAADQLAKMEEPDVPEPWEASIANMKVQAAILAGAEDLTTAGEAVGRLGQRCGDCHAATGGGPKAAVDEALKSSEKPPENHMRRHLWCADRMWLGLVGSHDVLFRVSAKILADTELHPRVNEEGTPEGFVVKEKQIHELAAEAAETPNNSDERARLYGHMLATCAACHTTVGVTPAIE